MSKTKAQLQSEVKKMRSALRRSKVAKSTSYVRRPRIAKSRSEAKIKAKPASSGIAANVGSAIGGLFGPGGAAMGAAAGKLFSQITGIGDYKVRSNSITMGTDPPSFGVAGRSTIIRHREFISDISGSTAFTLTQFPINPGLGTTFPWLSSVASNYEEYAIRGMVFEFKSTSADALNSTNTALGTVIMCTNYNVLRAPCGSKIEMENHEYTTSTKPSESCVHPIECAVGENPLRVLYTRTGAIGTGDQRMYDLGLFQIATVGMQAAAVIGELWCTYDIELLKPMLPSALGIYADHWTLDFANVAATRPYGNTPTLSAGSNFGTTVSGNDLIVPYDSDAYDFMFIYQCSGANTVLVNPLSYTTNAGVLTRNTKWHAATTSMFQTTAGDTASAQVLLAYIHYTPSATALDPTQRYVRIGATGTWPTALTGGDLWIVSMPIPSLMLPAGMPAETKSVVISAMTGPVPASIPDSKGSSGTDDDDDDPDYVKYVLAKRQKKLASLTSVPAVLPAAAAAAVSDVPAETPSRKATSKK